MKQIWSTRRVCRAGIIAALYVVLTWVFSALAYQGFLQIRPAEALCILPLFFPEAVPALIIGCGIANLTSPFAIYDVTFGALATALSALSTYAIGKALKKEGLKLFFGGLPPVIFNALIIPMVIVFLCGDLGGNATAIGAYGVFAASIAVTQILWVYLLGVPLYFTIKRLRNKKVKYFL